MRICGLMQWLIVLAVLLGFTAAALADTTITGDDKHGAFFQITVPTSWNGDLVIYNHGFDFNPPGPIPGPRHWDRWPR